MNILFNEAIQYSRRGWYVFPCREKPGAPFVNAEGITVVPTEKRPYTANGLNDATTDEEQIMAWWSTWPNAMIGVNAGKSGLFVVDIDKKNVDGYEVYSSWAVNDIAGLHATTPSGGMHVVFTGEGKTTTNGETGIDTRGEGGYFIAPPSTILEGDYPGEYKKIDDWNREPGVIPDGLLDKLFRGREADFIKDNNTPAEDGELKQLSHRTITFLQEGALPGERNLSLFKALADFCGCGYTKEQARNMVLPVSNKIGLPESEFEQVLRNAFSKERTPALPDALQEKILLHGKSAAVEITQEEQNIIEDALIVCMITHPESVPVIQDMIEPNDLMDLKNRLIFKAIIILRNSDLQIDYVTVSNEVAKLSRSITINDVSKLIHSYSVDVEHAITYANIIKEKSSIRKIESLLENKKKYFKEKSFVEMVYALEKDISQVALEGGVKSQNLLDGQQASDFVIGQTKKILSGEIEQLKTGFIDYDYEVGGIYSNELVVLAGRAGDGKSALSLSILNNLCIQRDKCGVLFSLEMSTHESVCRLVCQLTGIPFKSIYQGKMNEDEWKRYKRAMEQIKDSKLYFDDSFGITVPELRSKIRKLVAKDVSLIVIDQLEQIRGYETLPPYSRLDTLGYDIKRMTQEFNIPIILNHQLNRGVTDRKLKNPETQLSDLNQAGEKPANQVWAIQHLRDENEKIEKSKIKILKNRNGPTFDFPVVFLGNRMLFQSMSYQKDERGYSSTEYPDTEEQAPIWARRET